MNFRQTRRRLARPTAKAEGTSEASQPESNTFRVSGVPAGWNHAQLQSFLASQTSVTNVVIKSLAHEANEDCQTATITFENLSLQLQNARSWNIPLPEASDAQFAGDRHLSIEKDFLGLTTLFAPPPSDHKIDVIALSGLGGHAFGSFKEKKGNHMWLRDSLPYDLTSKTTNKPMARVMIYGYESAVAQSKNMQNLEDLATTFHSSLLAMTAAPTIKPIILIGHSLGGLIIKQTLISLSRSNYPDDERLVCAVYGIIFFGTPHDGMDISSLIPMVGDGPNRFLIESIGRINSQILSIQQRDFHNALGGQGDSEIFCFYETAESPTAEQDKSGCWKMTGPTAVLVTKSSATHCRSWENGTEHICAIARTHSNMVKFGFHDPDYKNVRERIKSLSRRAFTARRLQTTTSKFLIPYTQNPDFVDRSEILNNIKRQFGLGEYQDSPHPRRRVSLYGLGGVGKTQIAIAYVYWLQEACPDVSIFWVHASNADRFRAAYASIAEKCDVPGSKDPKADVSLLVKKWLEARDKMPWVMVVDNADDSELFFTSQQKKDDTNTDTQLATEDGNLARYLPECNHGWLLFTTRNKQVGVKLCQGKTPIEVPKMTDSEAYQLVKAILPDEISMAEMSTLSSKLEHLPLALAQAISYIQENCITIRDYIDLLDEGDFTFVDQLSEHFETVGRDSETPHAVTATWIISFQQIEQKESLASDILSLLSLLHYQAIPRVFIERYYRLKSPEESGSNVSVALTKALGLLKAFSFISEGTDQNVDMHRLVQLVMQKWLIIKHRMADFVECAIEVVSAIYPYGRFKNREICLRYLPHANSVLGREGTNSAGESIPKALLLHRIAAYFSDKGDWKTSENKSIQAVDIYKKILGEEHPDTLASINNLALTYWNQGRPKEAEDLNIQVLKIKKRVLGEEHPGTLISMNNLASTYLNQGRFKEAEELYIQALELRKRVLGEEHPDTLMSISNLAITYTSQGRLTEAEELGIQAIKMKKRVLGEEHPDILISINNLASTYLNQGRLKEAEELYIQALEIRKRVLGEEHPDTLMSISNLASTYRRQGRLTEAEELRIQAIKMEKRVLGEEHPDILISMNNLALIYLNQERLAEAEELGMQALKIQKRVIGEEHPDTLASMNNLAYVWKALGKLNDAIILMEDCLSVRERILGRNHPDRVSSLSTLNNWRREAK